MAHGIYIVADLGGEQGDRIAALQARLDPKLAALGRPHVTLAGSSGVGILPLGTPTAEVCTALEAVGMATAPLELVFGAPERFPQTNIIVLPLPVHGPVRWLHDRIATCGLPFAPARFCATELDRVWPMASTSWQTSAASRAIALRRYWLVLIRSLQHLAAHI